VVVEQEDLSRGVDLTGQVAIVTGGGRGIGRAIAQGLVRAGAAVAVVARTESQLAETVRLIEEDGGRAIGKPGDVTDADRMRQVVTETERDLGPVDLLVGNAGVIGPLGSAWELDPDEWWRTIDINLRGTFLIASNVLPGMVARGTGRIVVVASGAGTIPIAGGTGYVISKCAVIRLAEVLALETEQHGIRVFSLNPGFVRTALSEELARSRWDREDNQGGFTRLLAEGRTLPSERAAQLVVFLASGQADALSGCFLGVHQDIRALVAQADHVRQKELLTLRVHTA
jgi:NAD(P)-dependent dehydrogenase (short-subunit alcohol dehydrogenase family)